ncbi:MAG: tRNA (N(6)-L-threonylcarbamoyladenosine(37)-C(2))-methylthiotransferase MtaB [Treponema sp.]|jgi:threonylcarbamoyladenosine tRNA methylthiotransferase MtaB|nr:tRNA (N(6)-L-threonylcarbamoyladenosine(37)-C(2))-methylthiotransferase MtaB [Treponema sp.]
MLSFSIFTLGCKVNQLESESLAAAFRREGFPVIPWGEAAGILLINTCTVTSRADQKARRVIRKALRDNPRSSLIVTGCYAQMDAALIEALEAPLAGREKRLFVLRGKDKTALLDLPRYLRGKTGDPAKLLDGWFHDPGNGGDAGDGCAGGGFFRMPEEFSFHSRSFLKIQDGCDNHCTFCRVSLARGPSVSLGREKALEALRALENRSYGEAVLTGINISQYRDGEQDLGGLLEYLLAGTKNIALRLSSLEPEGLSEKNIRVFTHPRIRPHFHLSIQSGCPGILRKMGRSYGPEELKQGISLLRSVKEDPFLACDIITGFPGEGAAEFEKTLNFCMETCFAWIHAFPYSRRPGTAAWSFGSPVNEKEAARRVDALLDLARQGRREYAKRWIGRELDVIIEKEKEKNPGLIPGISDNYLRALIQIPPGAGIPPAGTALRCRLRELCGESTGIEGREFDVAAEPVPDGGFGTLPFDEKRDIVKIHGGISK